MAKKLSTIKKKPGRKPRPINAQKAYEAAKNGADMAEIATTQDRAPDANHFAKLTRKNEELRLAIKEGREEIKKTHEVRAIPAATQALLNMLNDPSHPGHTASVLFVHKAMLGYREGVKHEVSGEVSHVHSLSAEDRAKRISELKRELESAVDVELIEGKADDTSGT